MSCPASEEIGAAPPPPGLTTPTKPDRNDGAGHVSPDAEGTNAESDADVEKQFDESTGQTRKKRKFAPFLEYRVIEEWVTGPDSVLEDAEIDHEIKKHLKKFMQDSRLMIAPATEPEKKKTNLALWKQQRAEYYNSRTDAWILVSSA